MPAKTKTSLVMKIVAVVLILASAAMLFLPWMKVAVSMNGMTLSGSEIVQMSGQSMDAEETQRFNSLNMLLFADSRTSGFLMAEMKMQRMMAEIFETLTRSAGLEIPMPGM